MEPGALGHHQSLRVVAGVQLLPAVGAQRHGEAAAGLFEHMIVDASAMVWEEEAEARFVLC